MRTTLPPFRRREPRRTCRYTCALPGGGLLFLLALVASGCASSVDLPRWEFTNGPGAQNVSAMAIGTRDRSHLLAGLASGEVCVSGNDGINWNQLSTVHANTAINRFIQHPDDDRRVFAVTDSGLFVSSDAGTHWVESTVDDSFLHMTSRILAIDPYNPDIMYAGTSGHGIYKTTDGGARWRPCTVGLDSLSLAGSDVWDLQIDASRPDNVYGAVRGIGVVKSSDAGESWVKLASILGSGGITPTSIVIHPRSAGILCFGMEGGTIYRTTDDGRTWSPTHLGTGDPYPVMLVGDPNRSGDLFAGTGVDLLLSTDFGASWKSIAGTLPHVATSIAVAPGEPDPALYAYGEGIGIMRSGNNGTLWVPRDAGLGSSTVSAMAGDDRGTVLYACTGAAAHRWSPVTRGWIPASDGLAGGPIASVTVGADSSSIVHVATASGVFSTRDSGVTWTTGSYRLRGRQIGLVSAHPIFVTRVLANAGNELFASTDRGLTWAATKPVLARYHVHSFAYNPHDAGIVIGATATGIIISADGGISWEENSYGLKSKDVVAVTLDDRSKETLYAWTNEGEGYRSTNKGLVWDRYSPPWKAGKRVPIVFDRTNPSEVIAITDTHRLYYSRSGGGTWFAIPIEPLPGDLVSAYWNSQTATLYAGYKQAGVYRLPLGAYLKRLFED